MSTSRKRPPVFMETARHGYANSSLSYIPQPQQSTANRAATKQHWVIRRKALVVAAVRGGLLSLGEACNRYTLTIDEFLSWQTAIDQHGLAGLRATYAQEYRQK